MLPPKKRGERCVTSQKGDYNVVGVWYTREKSPLSSLLLLFWWQTCNACCRMSSLSSVDISKAADRIKPYVRKTPLEYSPWLSDIGKSKVYVKLGM